LSLSLPSWFQSSLVYGACTRSFSWNFSLNSAMINSFFICSLAVSAIFHVIVPFQFNGATAESEKSICPNSKQQRLHKFFKLMQGTCWAMLLVSEKSRSQSAKYLPTFSIWKKYDRKVMVMGFSPYVTIVNN